MKTNPIESLSAGAQTFWAKTGQEESPATGMSLAQHMLDSSQVAHYLWENWLSDGSKQWIQKSLNLEEAEAQALVSWLVGTHDIGKASPEFAGQLDARQNIDLLVYRQRIEDAGYDFMLDLTKVTDRCPHSRYSYSIIRHWLAQKYPAVSETSVNSLAQVSGSHHGKPAAAYAEGRDTELVQRVLQDTKFKNWLEAWDELLSFIERTTEAGHAILKALENGGLKPDLQFFITGLTIMCDWIASNPDYFPYGQVTHQETRPQEAFEKLNLSQPWQPEDLSALSPEEIYSSRFSLPPGATLRPMQKVVVEAARSLQSTGLMCIEAPMGQGKTEAGLVAAEILAHTTGKNGLMFAAPTQATADALFDRVADWGRKAAHGNETISMFLGHSKSNLNENFSRMRFAGIHADEGRKGHQEEARVIAHQWFSRKKGVLSNFVVGTVDQVLMMALASKHVMLRHLGLGEKVLVIDEVHAYDAYMNVYLENALEWLGRMQAPVILMSATLPGVARQKLMQAYARGLGFRKSKPGVVPARRSRRGGAAKVSQPVVESVDLSYPVIHTVSIENAGEPRKWEIEQPKEQQEFSLRLIDDSFAELDSVLAPLENNGGCAAIICNTVSRAQEVYEHLQGIFAPHELMLVHSRFIARDRVKNEKVLVEALGKKSRAGAGRPERFVVVGTQVIEQSLDIDFDVMITDHAPVDLVLQRMGRLHRHDRAGERAPHHLDPVCYVRGVQELGTENAVPVFTESAEKIYDRSILLSSYAQLMPHFEGKKLQIPADISALVQGAYSAQASVPEGWAETYAEAVQEWKSKEAESRRKAGAYSMRPGSGIDYLCDFFGEKGVMGDADELKSQAKVRDTDDTLEVLVVQSDDGGQTYRPLGDEYVDLMFEADALEKPDWKLANVLAGSSIRLPYQFADKGWAPNKNPFDLALKALETNQFSAWQQHHLLKGELVLLLDTNMECSLAGYRLRYSQELGLEVLREADSGMIIEG